MPSISFMRACLIAILSFISGAFIAAYVSQKPITSREDPQSVVGDVGQNPPTHALSQSSIDNLTAEIAALRNVISQLATPIKNHLQTNADCITQESNRDANVTNQTNNDLGDEQPLTPAQQQIFDELLLRIESAPYNGLSRGDLIHDMESLPQAYQQKISERIAALINSQQLDPRKIK